MKTMATAHPTNFSNVSLPFEKRKSRRRPPPPIPRASPRRRPDGVPELSFGD